MATTLNFADRFSYPAPNGISPTITADAAASLTDAQIIAASPDLAAMASLVRGFSVILSRQTTYAIFIIITSISDARIALFLAAAKKKTDNTNLFRGLVEVKELMYANPAIGATNYINRTLFSDGIRAVSAMLTASVLVGQLAQLPEQAEHSRMLEARAMADLERICMTYELSQAELAAASTTTEDTADSSIFFMAEDFTLTTGQTVVVTWFAAGLTSTWQPSNTYSGSFSAWQIVADLAEAINQTTVRYEHDATIIAVAQLAGARTDFPEVHSLAFFPRTPAKGIVAHSLSIRIELQNAGVGSGTCPVTWGLYPPALSTRIVNGLIFVFKENRASAISGSETDTLIQPTVLYLRNNVSYNYIAGGTVVPPTDSTIKIRVQFWMAADPDPTTDFLNIDFPRLLSTDPTAQANLDNLRFSQAAVAILQGVTATRNSSGVSAAIIRNEGISDVPLPPMAAVEIVAWTLSRMDTYVILDILQLPADLEMATGNLVEPVTLFSNNPKSIRAKCITISSGALVGPDGGVNAQPLLVKGPKRSMMWQRIQDEAAQVEWPIWWM